MILTSNVSFAPFVSFASFVVGPLGMITDVQRQLRAGTAVDQGPRLRAGRAARPTRAQLEARATIGGKAAAEYLVGRSAAESRVPRGIHFGTIRVRSSARAETLPPPSEREKACGSPQLAGEKKKPV